MAIARTNAGGGQNHAALTRMENTLASMGEAFAGFREELATIKSEQANQKQQIIGVENDWKTGLDSVNRSIDTKLDGVNEAIRDIGKRLQERDKPKTTFYISAFSTLLVLLSLLTGVAVFFVNSSIKGETTPLMQRVAGLEQLTADHRELEDKTTRSREADARSETDRSELNRRVEVAEGELSKNIAMNRERFATLQAGFVENETQFKNLTAMVYYMWSQVFGKSYPVIPRETPYSDGIGH